MKGGRPVEVLWCGRLRLSRGQPAIRLALLGQRDEGITAGLGLPHHHLDCPFPVVGFIGVYALLDVGSPMFQQAIDQAS